MKKADIGLVGLAVMGENLVMNMESKGFTVAVYNRTTSKVDEFVNGRAAGKNIIGTYSMEELVASIEKPRKIMMMIKAGSAVDATIDALLPLLDDGDIIIVDRAIEPYNNCKAVCYIDGEYTVKRVEMLDGHVRLMPANELNDKYKPIEVSPENQFMIWGVVTYVIKKA